jgi:hypothetical protein
VPPHAAADRVPGLFEDVVVLGDPAFLRVLFIVPCEELDHVRKEDDPEAHENQIPNDILHALKTEREQRFRTTEKR